MGCKMGRRESSMLFGFAPLPFFFGFLENETVRTGRDRTGCGDGIQVPISILGAVSVVSWVMGRKRGFPRNRGNHPSRTVRESAVLDGIEIQVRSNHSETHPNGRDAASPPSCAHCRPCPHAFPVRIAACIRRAGMPMNRCSPVPASVRGFHVSRSPLPGLPPRPRFPPHPRSG